MDKRFDLGTYTLYGEPVVQHIDPRDARRTTKLAAVCDGALGAMQTRPQRPGRVRVLVLAMTAYEFYGANRNGDGFTDGAYHARMPDGTVRCLVTQEQALPNHIHTFVSKGHNFLHHKNWSKTLAVGDVVHAFYNQKMRRVELILDTDVNLAGDFTRRILDHEYPAVSMGCRIPYDVCTICGNRAPTRAYYCRHCDGSDPSFGLGTILEDGREVAVLNPSPELFDISYVDKPADRVAYMMVPIYLDGAKTASIMVPAPATPYVLHGTVPLPKTCAAPTHVPGALKQAQATAAPTRTRHWPACADALRAAYKRAELLKDVPLVGVGPLCDDDVLRYAAQYAALPTLTDGALGQVAGLPSMCQGITSMLAAGHLPSVFEIHDILLRRMGLPTGLVAPSELVTMRDQMACGLDGDVTEAVRGVVDALEGTPPCQTTVTIIKQANAEAASGSQATPANLRAAFLPEDQHLHGAHATQTLHVQDPGTGALYVTNRDAQAQTAQDNLRRRALEAGAGAALTSLATGALVATGRVVPGVRRAALPVGVVGGGLSAKHLLTDEPGVRSLEGDTVAFNTPMSKVGQRGQEVADIDTVAALWLAERHHAKTRLDATAALPLP